MNNIDPVDFYQQHKKQSDIKYRNQARYLREELDITTIEKAVEFMRIWIPTQTFTAGIMAGESASVLLTCAILGQSIEPDENQEISFSKATVGVDLYYALKDAELW